MGMSKALATGADFLKLAILARLLTPSDFGLMGMIRVIIGFAQAFSDMGFSNAIIYRQDANQDQLSTIYWLSILTGVLVFALVWVATPLLVYFYHEPRLRDLLFWAALSFIITSIGNQFQVLLQKELHFNCLAGIEVTAVIIGATIAVVSAVAGQGVFSLIWGQLASAGSMALLLTVFGSKTWRPHLHFKRDDLKGYMSFGLYQMGERAVNYYTANVDYLIIGRFLGADILGIYTIAYELVVRPISTINPVVTRVAFPLFAKKQADNAALRRGYLEVIRLLAFIIFPLLIGLGVTAPLAIPVFFGKRWVSAIHLVQILVILGMLKSIENPIGSILLAKGRADIGFGMNAFCAAVNTCVFWFVVRYGVYAMAWAEVALCLVYFIVGLTILYFIIGLGQSEYFAALIKPTVASSAMGAIVFNAYFLLSRLALSRSILLLGLVMLGMTVFGLLMSVFERNYLVGVWNLVTNRKQEIH